MENQIIRFGIVGCGMAARCHAQAIASVKQAALAGACSRSPASADSFCRQFQIRKYPSYRAMLKDPEIDAVSICTPSGSHKEQAVQAMEAGKHVVIEKPMCLSLQDADEIIRLADQTGLAVCVVSQSRFSDAAQEVKRAVDAGAFGKMVSAALTMRYFRPQAYYDQAAWRGTAAGDGGGVLMNQGFHGIDLLCYLLRQPVSVCGYTAARLRHIEVEDTAAGAVRFSSHALATIDATVCSHPAFSRQIVLCGESGSVILKEDSISLWSLPQPCSLPILQTVPFSASADPKAVSCEGHAREYQNLVGFLLGKNPLLVDARQGKIALEVILGIYESSRTGKAVRLSP